MRAVTMFLIAMGARITGRIYDMMSALSVTAMILVGSPGLSPDSGFLLSFGCVRNGARCGKDLCLLQERRKNGQRHW